MRKRFEVQLELGQPAIEMVVLPKRSRDELPPLLKGLQWIFITPELNEAIFELLENAVVAGKQSPTTGRPGMDLWHILVLGIVLLVLKCDYDRREHIANYDTLVRQIMGLPTFGSQVSFHHKTISDNVCHLNEKLLEKINALAARHGLKHFKKTAKITRRPDLR